MASEIDKHKLMKIETKAYLNRPNLREDEEKEIKAMIDELEKKLDPEGVDLLDKLLKAIISAQQKVRVDLENLGMSLLSLSAMYEKEEDCVEVIRKNLLQVDAEQSLDYLDFARVHDQADPEKKAQMLLERVSKWLDANDKMIFDAFVSYIILKKKGGLTDIKDDLREMHGFDSISDDTIYGCACLLEICGMLKFGDDWNIVRRAGFAKLMRDQKLLNGETPETKEEESDGI